MCQSHMISVSFQWVSIVIDVFSIVYFRFQNYRNTDAIFIFDNIETLPFPIKKIWKRKWWSLSPIFSNRFHPCTGPTRCARQHWCIARVRTQTVCTPMEAHDDLACTLIPRVIGWVPYFICLTVLPISFLVNVSGTISFHVIYVAMKLIICILEELLLGYFRKKTIQVKSGKAYG